MEEEDEEEDDDEDFWDLWNFLCFVDGKVRLEVFVEGNIGLELLFNFEWVDKEMIFFFGINVNVEVLELDVLFRFLEFENFLWLVFVFVFMLYFKFKEKLLGKFKEFFCCDFFKLFKFCFLEKVFLFKVFLKELEVNIWLSGCCFFLNFCCFNWFFDGKGFFSFW